MKFYKLKESQKVTVTGLKVNGILSEEIMFHRVDGAYAVCTTNDGTVIYLPADTKCAIIRKKD